MFSMAKVGEPAATAPTTGSSMTPDRSGAIRASLEGRQVGVHRGRGGQTDRLSDVADGRRIALAARLGLYEVEDLTLPVSEVPLARV
jgi:hypothetical protein